MTPQQRAVAARATSLVLRHPDPDVLALVPTVQQALADLPTTLATPLATITEHLATHHPGQLAATYVDTFDFRRRCCLYLTYYTHGDTRARGEALARAAETYRTNGYTITNSELPDYLPAVLDLAAATGQPGWQILHTHRIGIDLLHAALQRDQSIYTHAITATRELLPPPTPADHTAMQRLAETGPPAELVGLPPFPTGGRT